MIRNKIPVLYLVISTLGLVLSTPAASPEIFETAALEGNTISGYVTGVNRRPVVDLYVELLDDYSRTLVRTRTSGTGYYSFSRLRPGRFIIHALTAGTDYEEQQVSVEILNIMPGSTTTESCDIALKLRKGAAQNPAAAIFVQADLPEEARKYYEQAVLDLADKRVTEGVAALKSAIEKFPKYYMALERLGTEYAKLGRPETLLAAEVLFSNAVAVNPRGAPSWYGLAYVRYSLDHIPDALTPARKAVEANSTWPEAVLLYGILLRRTKNYPETEKQLLRAAELSKNTLPQVHWELALLYGNTLKRYSEAAAELRSFLKAQPTARDAEKIRTLITEFEVKARSK